MAWLRYAVMAAQVAVDAWLECRRKEAAEAAESQARAKAAGEAAKRSSPHGRL